MGHGPEYIVVMIIVTVIAYCTITPIAKETANSLNNTAELIASAGG